MQFITECGGKIQTELPKTAGSTNSYCDTAKSFEANTAQLESLRL